MCGGRPYAKNNNNLRKRNREGRLESGNKARRGHGEREAGQGEEACSVYDRLVVSTKPGIWA